MHAHGSICSLIFAFLCVPTLSWHSPHAQQLRHQQHKHEHSIWRQGAAGATFRIDHAHCPWPWTNDGDESTATGTNDVIGIGICTMQNLSMAMASILLTLQLLCLPVVPPALAITQDADASSTGGGGAGLLGTSIVFDNFDEIPPIEENVMRGSASTIIPLRRVEAENCKIRSQFGDVLEIDYVAKKLAPPATVYDASIFRGTGQPFKFVLGSGVMIPGVDQGLYNMCPGEVRLLKVPPKLAVGLLDPPAKAPLEWKVELISIDGIIRQDNNNELTRGDRNIE